MAEDGQQGPYECQGSVLLLYEPFVLDHVRVGPYERPQVYPQTAVLGLNSQDLLYQVVVVHEKFLLDIFHHMSLRDS